MGKNQNFFMRSKAPTPAGIGTRAHYLIGQMALSLKEDFWLKPWHGRKNQTSISIQNPLEHFLLFCRVATWNGFGTFSSWYSWFAG